MTDLDRSGIAIVGMACRFPGAETPDRFWRNLRDGVESITLARKISTIRSASTSGCG